MCVTFETGDRELLLRILVLLHCDLVLDGLVAHFALSVPGKHDLDDQPHELLEGGIQKDEDGTGNDVGRPREAC